MEKVYIVGAGVGHPDYITVKGQAVLKQADVIIYDYLTDTRLLELARPGAEKISCAELGKQRYAGTHSESQLNINDVMVQHALLGKKVVRLKNGDPVLFARLSEEMDVLRRNEIDYEVIPGITAASAAAAVCGIPLSDRSCSSHVAFVTGHEAENKNIIDWHSLAPLDTLVLYMAVRNIGRITEQLIEAGKDPDTPVVVVSNIASMRQKTVRGTIRSIPADIEREDIEPPAIFIIGEVARFEERFNWVLNSRRILFTGLSCERYFLNGLYYHLPLISIVPLDDYSEMDDYIRNIGYFDWLVFGSRYGVIHFFQRLSQCGLDTRSLGKTRVAAVGQSTADKLREYGVAADLVPDVESSVGLLDACATLDMNGKKVFMPRSDLSDKGLAQGFEKRGAKVTSVIAYRNIMPESLPDIDLSFFDEIFFTSPSTVRNFCTRYGQVPGHITVTCIGDVTLKEARKWNIID
ncbi:MAG: uroporphyrinogen-III C-methyltransferase [Candidatus Auribacterota bacterium]